MIRIFRGGGTGGRWGGGSSEVRWLGVIKGSFQKHLKTGLGKGKSCS